MEYKNLEYYGEGGSNCDFCNIKEIPWKDLFLFEWHKNDVWYICKDCKNNPEILKEIEEEMHIIKYDQLKPEEKIALKIILKSESQLRAAVFLKKTYPTMPLIEIVSCIKIAEAKIRQENKNAIH